MTRERLLSLSYENLIHIAQKGKIDYIEDAAKDELVTAIIDAYEEDQQEREEMYNLAVRIASTKYDVSLIEELDIPQDEEIELPESYNENRMILMLRDPAWAFLYWDLEEKKHIDLEQRPGVQGLFLRIYEMDGSNHDKAGVIDSYDIPVTLEDSRRYLNLPERDTFYMAELRVSLGETDLLVLQSNIIETSREFMVPSRSGVDENQELLVRLSGFSSDVGNFPGSEGRGIIQHRILPVDQEEE